MGEDVSQHQNCSAHCYSPFQHVGCQTDSLQIRSAGTQTNLSVGMHSVGIQSAWLKSTSVGTQLSMGSLKAHVRSKAMQTQVSPLSVDLGTTSHLPDSPLTYTPINGPGWRPSKRPWLELKEEEESDSSNESHKELLDSTCNPGNAVITAESDVSFETQPTQNEAKYIVFDTCLKQLLENCPMCKGGSDLQQRRIGTYVAFTQRCLHCSYFRQWESQPMVGNTPVSNLQLPAATYFTGSSFVQLQKQTPDTILIKVEEDISGGMPAVEDYDYFRDRNTQCGAASESLHVDAPGSSHMSSHSEELRILSVYGKGEGPLAVNGHDTLFTTSEVEALSSLSEDHSVDKSLECGKRLVRREELTVQQTPNTILIKVEEDIGGGMPAVGDYDYFRDCSTQRGAASESLHVDAPGSSHMSSHSEELRILSVYGKGEGPLAVNGHDTLFTMSEVEALRSLSADHSVDKSLECGKRLVRREELTVQQTPDTILIKVEEDIGGDMPAVEDYDDFRDCSTQRGATTVSLHVDAPGSSHMSSHSEELRILSVYGKGEGQLAVNGHDTLFTVSEVEALSLLSADHSVAKSLERGKRIVDSEELTGHRGGRKGRPCVLSGDNTKMTIHMRTHTSEKPYGCDQCMKRFSHRSYLKNHMRTHSGEKPYSCDQCMKSFSQSSNLKIHMRTHSGEKLYRCDQCMKSFSTSYNLKIHMRTHSGEKPYRCDQCMKRFSTSSVLKIHMRTHSEEKPYGCDQCMKRFGRSCLLKDHMRTHSGEKPYSCDQCMKSFSTSYNLKIHMRTHSGEKPYRCDQCMKHFSTSSVLKIHMRTHSEDKPYGCDQCIKRFRRSCLLKIHMRTHSGEKPYGCDQCMKRFGQSSYLKDHMRTHSGEKPYGCDQCMKRFGWRSHLKIHMQTHSKEKPYRCKQCMKLFGRTSDLKIHMMTHSGEKPYGCDQCMKRFGRSSSLKIHMRTHSGEKPCVCLQCNASFSNPSNLRCHMLRHTGNGVLLHRAT